MNSSKTGIDWLQKDKDNIWHPFTPLKGGPEHILIKSAKGVILKTEDDREIIDAVSSWWVNIHGHSHPYIAEAISRQALELEHVIFAGFTHKPAIQLSSNLLKILPQNQKKIFFSDNGSTSVEVGLKMAFQYWHNQGIDKKKVIAIEGAYHGDTFGSMSVGGRSAFTKPYNPYLFDVDFIDFPTHKNQSDVINSFQKLVDTGEVAAFIFEPLIQGAAGMRMYSAETLDALMSYAKNHSVICIADEVMTGFGRTGKMFASDHLKNNPDIICLSKGLTGGTMALGVTTCSQNIVEAFETSEVLKTFFHGHSFTANPLACAVANASWDLFTSENCQQSIINISESHISVINQFSLHPMVKEARCLGTIMAIEIDSGNDTSYFNDLRKSIYPFFLDKEILLRPLGNVIYILPPYVISQPQLDKIYETILEFLNSIK